MTNKLKRIFATVLICTLMIGCSSHAAMNAEAKSVNKFTLRVGQKDTLRVTNCKKKTKWKITSGKRVIKIVKRKKNSIVIKARRKGVAKITVKAGKQRWYVKIVVKAKKAAKKVIPVKISTLPPRPNIVRPSRPYCKWSKATVFLIPTPPERMMSDCTLMTPPTTNRKMN